MRVFVGVDIGGTYTKVGVLGNEFESVSFNTPSNKEALINQTSNEILKLADGRQIGGIGIGVPGAVDKSGNVDYMPNLGFTEFNPAKMLGDKFGVYAATVNDADAAALGESEFGGFTDAVMLTLGTGVGGGIVLGGKVYEGKFGKAAELGHMIICADGRPCGCGLNGCLEAYASATALIKRAREVMSARPNSILWKSDVTKLDAKAVFDAAKSGDDCATAVVEEYIKYLSVGIINICNIFRPEAVIIGGGISNQGEWLIERINGECEKLHYGYKYSHKPRILQSRLADSAGVRGAIAFIKYKENMLNEKFRRD